MIENPGVTKFAVPHHQLRVLAEIGWSPFVESVKDGTAFGTAFKRGTMRYAVADAVAEQQYNALMGEAGARS